MKNFLLFVLFFALVFSLSNKVLADTSNIAKLVFITEPQSIAPNTVSKYLTLQIQDVSGNQVAALETIRFDAFQTTSPTGTFVSCTTPANPPTSYLSTNGSNKNICYKDSTEGVYTLTAKTNNTVNSLSSTQLITISSITTQPTGGDSTGTSTATTTATTTNTTTSTNNSGSSYYAYSSSVSLSTYEPLSLSVEAGRERLGFLHTPMEFKAYAQDKKTGKSISGARYYWTFGDGSSGEGNIVSHMYLFLGEYNVVLNSYSGDEDAVDITKVKVVEPQIKVVSTDFYLEFINENSTDLNIGGWKVRGNDREYIIPRDTIVSANNNLKISSNIIGSAFGGEKITVLYPDGQLAFEMNRLSNEEKKKQISQLSEKLLAIQNQLYLAYGDAGVSTFVIPAEAGELGVGPERKDGDGRAESWSGDFSAEKYSGLQSENPDLDPRIREDNKQEDDNGKQVTGENMASSIASPASKNILSKIVDFFATMFK